MCCGLKIRMATSFSFAWKTYCKKQSESECESEEKTGLSF